MKTVKEISELTGISVRTLHYYDEIELFQPTCKSEVGYRLYDDKALERLQQILFFREFDIPLKQIKFIMKDPALDKSQILQMQRKMLLAKKQRVERLIASIDDILKGDSKMEFEIFNKNEIEEIHNAMVVNMTDAQKQIFIDLYGDMEKWRENFLEKASTSEVQRNFEKVVEWYGDKEAALKASMNPENTDIQLAYQKRMGTIMQKLADNKEKDVNSFAIKSLIGEYEFLTKQMFQMECVAEMVLEIAKAYQTNKEIQEAQDSIYGEGTTAYIGNAMEAFYKG